MSTPKGGRLGQGGGQEEVPGPGPGLDGRQDWSENSPLQTEATGESLLPFHVGASGSLPLLDRSFMGQCADGMCHHDKQESF